MLEKESEGQGEVAEAGGEWLCPATALLALGSVISVEHR